MNANKLNPSSQRQNKNFDIAIVNYQTLELTKACLGFLKQHLDSGLLNKQSVNIWVVDNDSQDESTAYLQSLDWINLIERKVHHDEPGFVAHGNGLDLILEQVKNDYLFVMHTDTFVYDPSIFQELVDRCLDNEKIYAIGCLHQINRGTFRFIWRGISRFLKHYSRRLKKALGLKAKHVRPYSEKHIKSFFALWNVKLLKQQQLKFLMDHKNPGYKAQDILSARHFKLELIRPQTLFKSLEHVESGTVSLRKAYSQTNRRTVRKQLILSSLKPHLQT